MSPRYPALIQEEKEEIESKLQEVADHLSELEKTREILQIQVAAFGLGEAPVHKIRQLEDIIGKIKELEGNKEIFAAQQSSLEAELEQSLLFHRQINQLESEREPEPTFENLRRLIRETEDLVESGAKFLESRLASYYDELAQLSERRGNGEAVRALEYARDIYRRNNEESKFQARQGDLVRLLIKQGDDHYGAGGGQDSLQQARRKYTQALDESKSLKDRKQAELRSQILGRLARLHEEQKDIDLALEYRLDRLLALIELESTREVHSEIKDIGNFCHRLENVRAAQSWVKRVYQVAAMPFFHREDLDGFGVLRELGAQFSLSEMVVEVNSNFSAVEEKKLGRHIELQPEWQLPSFVEGAPSQRDLTRLREILTERFNESELRTLCFELAVDYDALESGGIADKARDLILHLRRRNQVPILKIVGQRLRPDILWE